MLKLKGVLKLKLETVQVSDKFSKREFVVTENSNIQYPQDIQLQLTQDKCSLLDGVNIGSEVEVSFNLKGRVWTNPQGDDKYFNTLEAWRIDVKNSVQTPAPPPPPAPMQPTAILEDDDLPF